MNTLQSYVQPKIENVTFQINFDNGQSEFVSLKHPTNNALFHYCNGRSATIKRLDNGLTYRATSTRVRKQ